MRNSIGFPSSDALCLNDLLAIPTHSPMETDARPRIREAQNRYFIDAQRIGFHNIHHAPADPQVVDDPLVPETVRARVREIGSAFLESQPNMVLRLGDIEDPQRTLMLNFHMDTVDGDVVSKAVAGRFSGRGASDMKGPGVALLTASRLAQNRDPHLTDDISILIQCVSGEEGGAMGTYGTRVLCKKGYLGRLNIFAEPSNGYYFDHSTTSMTARIEVNGEGATDDAPQCGENATLLLSFVAVQLTAEISPMVEACGGKFCLGGIEGGNQPNRVYGSGALHVNIQYPDLDAAKRIQQLLEEGFQESLKAITKRFGVVNVAAKTAAAASDICRLRWIKQGLPVLSNRDSQMERVLSAAGLRRSPEYRRDQAFTCDAMWAQGPNMYTVVYGPGSLTKNGAHTPNEFVEQSTLEEYADSLANVIASFARHTRRETGKQVRSNACGAQNVIS